VSENAAPRPFVKERPGAPEGFFEAEAAGLSWLRAARGARVVDVHGVGEGWISLERIDEGRPDAAAAAEFGAALAVMHDAGAGAYGAPPDRWDGPVFIGRRRQPCDPTASWGEFYAEQRVRPFLDAAVRAGSIASGDATLVRRACDLVASGAFDDDDERPARLHGDLWSGNVLWSPRGVVLIDPAAHGGHRETDLAMLDLFGCPFFDRVIDAYDAQHPLAAGWADRVPLHQLHPLAVHAAGHGPSYGAALADAARRTLALV